MIDSSRDSLRPFCTRSTGWILAIAATVAGCDSAPQTGDPPQGLMVFVDLKTKEPVIDLATTDVPAVNPDTGERTLMPGLYCTECQRWHPTPAYDKLQRSPGAGRCPTDGAPLTSDGPWPTGENL